MNERRAVQWIAAITAVILLIIFAYSYWGL
jgi:hypothetical protein